MLLPSLGYGIRKEAVTSISQGHIFHFNITARLGILKEDVDATFLTAKRTSVAMRVIGEFRDFTGRYGFADNQVRMGRVDTYPDIADRDPIPMCKRVCGPVCPVEIVKQGCWGYSAFSCCLN